MKESKFRLNWPKILVIFTCLAVFVFLIYPYSDYDWGWHFRYGEYFIKTGQVLRDNLYTWTLPNYKWANTSWGFDIILYLSYIKLGFLGLSLLGSAVILATFLIPIVGSGLNYLLLGGLAFFFVKLSEDSADGGLRGQLFGTLFLCILITILTKATAKPKLLFLIPPLILIWVNVHASFSLGILILAIFIASNALIKIINRIRHKANTNLVNLKTLILVSFLSLCVSFVNPFTYNIYLEGLKHFINPILSHIAEWSPPSYGDFVYLFIFQAILIIIFAARKRLSDLPYIITLLLLSVESYLHNRYLAMFVAASLPIFVMTFSNLKFNGLTASMPIFKVIQTKLKSDKHNLIKVFYSIILAILLFIGLFVRLPTFNLANYNLDNYCYYSSNCSNKLADFLIKNPPVGRGFNLYDWGGFLIGRGVNAKLFVDGRMSLWEENGFMPIVDFANIYYGQDVELFRQYNFDWVIVRNDSFLAKRLLTPDPSWGTWKIVYTDDKGSYFVRVRSGQ